MVLVKILLYCQTACLSPSAFCRIHRISFFNPNPVGFPTVQLGITVCIGTLETTPGCTAGSRLLGVGKERDSSKLKMFIRLLILLLVTDLLC